ncbi:uncharacterized protein LOC112597703 [Melanaphis sacchari]|uniref:uncharacterized protein LOC112597703 n=1 Tax=Melanaphis sacchari TaxID=742174 RepID=UPI000DC14047|nr:uncharacterized protein LOC112597703 [Melanaphis sacchari]
MNEKPRVVSACMKRIIRTNGRAQQRPLISGSVTATLGDDSACAGAGDETFSGRSVAEVRAGHLLVRWNGPAGYCWKLLLRYLNLTATEHATYGFSLVRPGSKTPIVTIVVDTDTDYHHWTTTIAGQLLSQTPLDDVKYLDILGIVTDHAPLRRYSSTDSLMTSASKYKRTSLDTQEINNNHLFGPRVYKKNVSHLPDLIRECEQLRNRTPINEFSEVIPVKQKCKIFEESLICSSKSVENLHGLSSHITNIKSRSMNNLDLDLRAVPVKDICRYFESRFNSNEPKTIQFRSLY